MTEFKIFFSRTAGSISTKHGTKHPWEKGSQGITRKDHYFLEKEIIFFLSQSTFWYNHSIAQILLVFFLIWIGFSGERCGPWANCSNCHRGANAFLKNVLLCVCFLCFQNGCFIMFHNDKNGPIQKTVHF